MVKPMMNFSSPKLSLRLARFAQYYQAQHIIWDVGCDHAHLGLSFLNHPHGPEIHLVDPALPVIKKLQDNIDADIPRAHLFHMSGQEIKLNTNLSHFIFIAGMGGPEIISIMKELLPQMKEGDRLLISPHTKVLAVREFLQEQGPWLHHEEVIEESGIWYPHFLLGWGGRLTALYGDEIFQTEAGSRYAEYLREKLTKHQDQQSKDFLNFLRGL